MIVRLLTLYQQQPHDHDAASCLEL